ncbi:MAG: hypothetical protein O3A01_06880 [bacterium]|nr:hypothetical protein [bacterium]
MKPYAAGGYLGNNGGNAPRPSRAPQLRYKGPNSYVVPDTAKKAWDAATARYETDFPPLPLSAAPPVSRNDVLCVRYIKHPPRPVSETPIAGPASGSRVTEDVSASGVDVSARDECAIRKEELVSAVMDSVRAMYTATGPHKVVRGVPRTVKESIHTVSKSLLDLQTNGLLKRRNAHDICLTPHMFNRDTMLDSDIKVIATLIIHLKGVSIAEGLSRLVANLYKNLSALHDEFYPRENWKLDIIAGNILRV